MKERKLIANNVGAFIGCPHFGENTLESPTAYTNSKSKIKTLTSDNKGITLIALVITIIVMLILVAVIVTIAINGGLFSTAKQAKADTQKEIDKEQELSNERIEIDGVWYDSFDEYLAGKKSPNQGKGNWTLSKEGDTVTSGDVTLKIGDYVNYKPNNGTYSSDKLTVDYTGSESNKSNVTTDTTLKWRVLGVDANGCLTLISDKLTNKTVFLRGAKGYNNGVYILNDICKTLYSNTELGVTARSITIEDIEAGFSEKGIAMRDQYTSEDDVKYGETKTYTSNLNYPVIYVEENGSGIGVTEEEAKEEPETKIKKDGIGGSDSYYNEKQLTSKTSNKESDTADKALTCKQTHYSFDFIPQTYCKNEKIHEMIFKINSNYWLASRYVLCSNAVAYFGLRIIGSDENIDGFETYKSDGKSFQNSNFLRPVVSLGPNIKIEAVENNFEENPHIITELK